MNTVTQPLTEIWGRPLDLQPRRLPRVLTRLLTAAGRRFVLSFEGAEHIHPRHDPLIVAANHSNRLEAVLLPALLSFHRRGRLVHFLADWPMSLVPLVSLLYRQGEVIPVAGKSARWRPFNVFKPRGLTRTSGFDGALEVLRSGRSVGLFPEGTMNRHPRRLLRGQRGAARLALATGRPIVPIGIRFPRQPADRPIGDGARMAIVVGEPIRPPESTDAPAARTRSGDLHRQMMQQIARLSGKRWSPTAHRRRVTDAG